MRENLKKYNTFGISVFCNNIFDVYTESDFADFVKLAKRPYRILGGGSNVLLTQDLNEDILVNKIKGIKIIEEGDEEVLIEVGGGEIWHQLVMWSAAHNLGGIENMALIPGSVGAAPIQNIGAYGIEQKDAFVSLRAVDRSTGNIVWFSKEECRFGYRDSIFKNEAKDKYIIVAVQYLLQKNTQPEMGYKDVKELLSERGIKQPTVLELAQAVIDIREAKLPNPSVIGNAGSFFKNPVISLENFESLKNTFPEIPNYPAGEGQIKLAAAWLIDQCGYKGKRHGNTGSYQNQALVIVNHGGATGTEIWEYAQMIQQDVKTKFGVELEAEVNVW
ncbi:MAG TPA: UDP-N-acetylmuramate dehydrogenase [Saprospiraceae bacterium]|nr:UDP-N-acetylmuramate dehydrogenase [Saprospiraceae bacterium]